MWRRAGALSGTPLQQHPREQRGASVQTNCTGNANTINLKKLHVVSNGFYMKAVRCFNDKSGL